MYVPTGSVPVGDKNSPMFGESSDPLKSRSVLACLDKILHTHKDSTKQKIHY